MLKKFPLEKISNTNFVSSNSSQFYSVLLLHSFTHHSLTSLEICVWDFQYLILSRLYFCWAKIMDSLTSKRHNSCQNKNNNNSTVLLPDLRFLSCNKNKPIQEVLYTRVTKCMHRWFFFFRDFIKENVRICIVF